MAHRAGLLLGILALGACATRSEPYTRAIEEDPSAANYWRRADLHCGNSWPADLERTLASKTKALADLDQAIALDDSGTAFYLSHRALWTAGMFKLTGDPTWREQSLIDFADVLKQEPLEERNHFYRGKAFLTCFDDPAEAVRSFEEALRLCQGRADASLWELRALEQLASAYTALAKATEGRPESSRYRELARSTEARHTELYRIRNKSTIESFEAPEKE